MRARSFGLGCLAGAWFVLLMGGPMAGGASDDVDDETLVQAEQALAQRRFGEAAELAGKVIERKKDSPEAYFVRARALRQLGKLQEAISDFDKTVELKPSAGAHLLRGECRSALERHRDAISDFDRAVALDPKLAAAYHLRGRERFKVDDFKGSILDFDRAIELNPAHENECWERGLSRYYAGQFALAQKSFEDYHKVGPEDIENGLWRMLSQAEVRGIDAARKDLFKYEPKRRPPFPLLYDLFTGSAKPDDVLSRATDGAANDVERRERRFYAHLYVGLWHVMNKRPTDALKQLDSAVALKSGDYMWHVARVQRDRLAAKADTPGK